MAFYPCTTCGATAPHQFSQLATSETRCPACDNPLNISTSLHTVYVAPKKAINQTLRGGLPAPSQG